MSVNIPEFSVSEFSRSIKCVVEDAFGYVKIKGEITGFKRASSGHLYFSLKDEGGVLSAVCFRGAAAALNFEVADGLEVAALGKITTFEGRSNYQIIVDKLEIAGIGAILEMLEKRRQKLAAEGLFDQIHKKPLPFFPKIIGVITSETGAVLQDIKHRVEARCPTYIKLYPSLVQGEKAAAEISAGIKFFNKLKNDERPQVLIIARGGGSFEDLLPFNDEQLVRAVFASEIPIISAVGHETDTTLIDYVADLRAPTPSAAAELATPLLSDLKSQINFYCERLNFLSADFIAQKFQNVRNMHKHIVDPAKILAQINDRFVITTKRLAVAVRNLLEKKSHKIAALQISSQLIVSKISMSQQKIAADSKRLESRLESDLKIKKLHVENLGKLLKTQHYSEILKRGFALVKNHKGELISSISKIKNKDQIVTEFSDGKFSSYVLNSGNEVLKPSSQESEIPTVQPKLI